MILALPALLLLQGPAPEAVDDRRALIVGISDYSQAGGPDGGWNDLRGAVKDAEAMRELLVDRFGFPEDQVLLLTDAEATHEGIVRAFHEHLIAPAGPDTEAVFYFAGHGSRVPDASGAADETGGADSTLVPYDARVDEGGRVLDLTDDELHSMLRALAARTERITVITDCCHSSGNTRGPLQRTARSAPPGAQPLRFEDVAAFWPEGVDFLDDGDPRRLQPLPHVHVAACAVEEQAYETLIQVASDRWEPRGMLTWHLDLELRRAEPGESWEAVMARVAERVRGQRVQVAGARERTLFSGDFAAPLPGFGGRLVRSGRFVELDAGTLHLLREGAVLEVTGLDGSTLGTARVRRVGPRSSELSWIGEVPADALALADAPVRALLQSLPAADEPLELALPEHEAAAAVAQELKAMERLAVEIVPRHAARLMAHVAGDGAWQLWDVETDVMLARAVIPDGPGLAAAVAEALAPALRREQRYAAFLRLAAERSPLAMDARFEAMPADALDEIRASYGGAYAAARVERARESGLSARASGRLRVIPDGGEDVASLARIAISMPEGPAARPLHVAVLCLSEDRSVSVVYPAPGDRENVIEPGDPPLRIPVVVFRNETWQLERDLRDRYLVIGTDQWADFSPLQQQGLLIERPTTRGDEDDALPPLLEQAMYGALTRGERVPAGDPGFAVTAVDVWVGEPSP